MSNKPSLHINWLLRMYSYDAPQASKPRFELEGPVVDMLSPRVKLRQQADEANSPSSVAALLC